jgi:hypothetical protein
VDLGEGVWLVARQTEAINGCVARVAVFALLLEQLNIREVTQQLEIRNALLSIPLDRLATVNLHLVYGEVILWMAVNRMQITNESSLFCKSDCVEMNGFPLFLE